MNEAQLESDLDLIHVIYDDGRFRTDLPDVMKRWPVYKAGFDYNVLAILGPQSSGKSTLLNGLFGTTFPTMMSQEGRYQCTKGIWLGRAAKSSTLVLDVEGTDGRERGEAEVAFEKKTSLFSLALAEVLIVNMWMQDVGRNNAANLPLLKTVFDINLQLFAHEKRSKTMLLFIIRDHVRQATPLEKLVAIITKDLEDIWTSIPKQEPFTNAKLSEFFEFSFESLPHKLLEPDKFTDELAQLSERFNNPKNSRYLWSKSFKGTVPADGLAHYASKIWETILTNKDLDLPTQREMLAMFRCDEISSDAYTSFAQALAAGILAKLQAKAAVDDFGVVGAELLRLALSAFDQSAEHYHPDVVARKREGLQAMLLKDLKDAWNTNVSLLSEHSHAAFEQELARAFGSGDVAVQLSNTSRDFGAIVRALKRVALERFGAAVAASVPAGAAWDYALAVEQLEHKIDASVQHEKERQLKMVMDGADQALSAFFAILGDVLEVGRANMWAEIRKEHAKVAGTMLDELRGKLETFGLPQADMTARLDTIADKLRAQTRKLVESQHVRLDHRMEKAFDGVFRIDESGVPRVWKPGTDITVLLQAGRAAARKVLDRYAVLRLDEGDDDLVMVASDGSDGKEAVPAAKVLLSRARIATFEEHLLSYSNSVCKDAQTAIDQYGKAGNTPIVVIVLLIVLGWNELMYILSNPLMLVLVVTLASGAYAVYVMGLLPFITPVVNAGLNQAMVMVNNAIAGATAHGQPTPAMATTSSSSSSSSSTPSSSGRTARSKKDE